MHNLAYPRKRITVFRRILGPPLPKGERRHLTPSESTWLGQRSGNWNSGFNNQGTNGYYWSSTQNSATNAYNLNFNSSSVNPANNNNKNNGFAVRCVAT